MDINIEVGVSPELSHLLKELTAAIAGIEIAKVGPVVSVTNSSTPAATPAAAPAPEKPKRTRRTKAQIAADKKAKEAEKVKATADAAAKTSGGEPAKKSEPDPPAPEEPTLLTRDDVRAKVRPFHQERGKEATEALFKDLGGASVSAISSQEDFAKVIERIDAIKNAEPAE